MRANRTAVALAVAATAYAVVLSAASLARQRWLDTGGYDRGIFDQAVWLLGHGHAPFSTIRGRNLFADHFQPALVLLAPLGTLGLLPGSPACGARRAGSRSPLPQWANLFDYHPETAVPLLIALGAPAASRRTSRSCT